MPFGAHLAMTIGFFAGIIPSILLVFYTLKDYDGYYQDKHFFFLIVVGLLGGTLTAIFYYSSIPYLFGYASLLVIGLTVFIFAVYEMLLFTILLSMKRFGGKYDLTYYGVVIGGSIAGVLVMFSFYVFLTAREINEFAVLSMVLTVPTIPMMYISIGTMIGFGIYRHKFIKYAGWSVVFKTIFNGIFILWYNAFLFFPPDYGWELMIFGLIFAFFMYYNTTQDLLPKALPARFKKHRRRKKRIERRKH